jgi:hypothetical protein
METVGRLIITAKYKSVQILVKRLGGRLQNISELENFLSLGNIS